MSSFSNSLVLQKFIVVFIYSLKDISVTQKSCDLQVPCHKSPGLTAPDQTSFQTSRLAHVPVQPGPMLGHFNLF